MMFSCLYVGALALALAVVLVAAQNSTGGGWIFDTITPSVNLTWQPCFTNFSCALLDVPLDYAHPTSHRASIPLIKLPAAANSPSGPYAGMILSNPGGPGGPGIPFILTAGPDLQRISGTNYDIVSFDPRGLGSSQPSANCTLPPRLRRHRRRHLAEIHGPRFLDSYFEGEFQLAALVGGACEASIGGAAQAGPHMTSTVNARDMLRILDAFAASADGLRVSAAGGEGGGGAEAGMLNYWGFSYGTFLGEVFASLFPERIRRVVLDGVVDPRPLIAESALGSIVDQDSLWATFFVYCSLAGPEACPFSEGGSARDVYLRFERLFTQLDPRRYGKGNETEVVLVEAVLELVKAGLLSVTYNPITDYPTTAGLLVTLEGILNNGSIADVLKLGSQAPLGNEYAWYAAVACTDDGGVSFNLTLEELRPYIHKLEKQGVIAGEIWSSLRIQCTGWSIKGVDIFTGPFGGATANPILFVSNTLDPVTPHINGHRRSQAYKDAQLLTIEGEGHTSKGPQNKCSFAKIQTYFQTGALPGKHNSCEHEARPFNITLPEGIEKRDDWKELRRSLRGFRDWML